MAWIMQGNRPVNTGSVAVPGTPFVGDSPYTFWRIDPNANGGMPYVPMMIGVPVISPGGAFKDAAYLKKVTIPQSCLTFGENAFAGTQLQNVTINANSTYAETTFPEVCEVQFYGGGGDYVQLIDGQGRAVVDGRGRRVYIKSGGN